MKPYLYILLDSGHLGALLEQCTYAYLVCGNVQPRNTTSVATANQLC
jgi:hypothetical protein